MQKHVLSRTVGSVRLENIFEQFFVRIIFENFGPVSGCSVNECTLEQFEQIFGKNFQLFGAVE